MPTPRRSVACITTEQALVVAGGCKLRALINPHNFQNHLAMPFINREDYYSTLDLVWGCRMHKVKNERD